MTFQTLFGYFLAKFFRIGLYYEDTQMQKLIVLRGLFGVSVIIQNIVIFYMPLQKSAVLVNTAGIFTVIITAVLYRQAPSKSEVILILVSTFGICLLMDPALVGFGNIAREKVTENLACKFTTTCLTN